MRRSLALPQPGWASIIQQGSSDERRGTMTEPDFGALERLDPRKYFPNEATDFTPWLAGSISLLGSALGLDLEVVSTEHAVGSFSADIVCRDTADGSSVVVENQLDRTDHDHLGKLLTYAAGIEDVRSVVWIAPRFTEEHRAALDWLNGVTDDSTRFFGVEFEVWRIGTSPPAPRFNLIAKPNEWSKTVKTATSSGPLSERKLDQLEFWTAFRQHLSESNSPVSVTKAVPETWVNAALGRSGIHISVTISDWDLAENTQADAGVNRIEVVMGDGNAAAFFSQLQSQREMIENRLGDHVVWYEPANAQVRKVFVQTAAPPIAERDAWSSQFEWLREHLETFDKLFRPLAAALVTESASLGSERTD